MPTEAAPAPIPGYRFMKASSSSPSTSACVRGHAHCCPPLDMNGTARVPVGPVQWVCVNTRIGHTFLLALQLLPFKVKSMQNNNKIKYDNNNNNSSNNKQNNSNNRTTTPPKKIQDMYFLPEYIHMYRVTNNGTVENI